METGLYIGFGAVISGHEKEALDLFTDASTYYGKKLADGQVTFFEPFLMGSGDFTLSTGFMIVKGPAPEIFSIMEESAFHKLNLRATHILEHFTWNVLIVGEGVGKQLDLFKAVSKL